MIKTSTFYSTTATAGMEVHHLRRDLYLDESALQSQIMLIKAINESISSN